MIKLDQIQDTSGNIRYGTDMMTKGLDTLGKVAGSIGDTFGAANQASINERTQSLLSNIQKSENIEQYQGATAESLESQYGTLNKGVIRDALLKLPETVFINQKAAQNRAAWQQQQNDKNAKESINKFLAVGDYSGAKKYIQQNANSMSDPYELTMNVKSKESEASDLAKKTATTASKNAINSFINRAVNSDMKENKMVEGVTEIVKNSSLPTAEASKLISQAKEYYKSVNSMSIKQKEHYDSLTSAAKAEYESVLLAADAYAKNYAQNNPITDPYSAYDNIKTMGDIMQYINDKAPDNAIFYTADRDVNASNARTLIDSAINNSLKAINQGRAKNNQIKKEDLDFRAIYAAVESMPYDSDDREFDFSGLNSAVRQNLIISLNNQIKVKDLQKVESSRLNTLKEAKMLYQKALKEAKAESLKI